MSLDALFKHNDPFYSDSLAPAEEHIGPVIRLLRIQPGRFEDPVVCELSTVELNKDTEYTALSYVWGKYEKPETIELNGKPGFWVTQNAFQAMRRLRQHNTEGVTVWIDAICIRQTIIDERSAQVALMGKIYSGAKTVFVYLGSCSGQPEDIPELEICYEASRHDDVKIMQKTVDPDSTGGILQNDDDGEDDSGPYQWWQRCWTFQETMLAHEIVFSIGPHRYNLEQMYDLAKIGVLPIRLCLALDDLRGEGLYDELRPDHRDKEDEESMLFRLLIATAARHATEPRDKVYSLLSLHVSSQPTIKIDYSSPIETVAYDTTLALLKAEDAEEWSDKLYQLQIDFGFAYREPWTSWIPDFCSPGILPQGRLFDNIGSEGTKRRYGRKASKEHSQRFSITETTLQTQSLELDTIALVVRSSDFHVNEKDQTLAKAQWLASHVIEEMSTRNAGLEGHHHELSVLNKHKGTPEWRTLKGSRSKMDQLTNKLSYAGIMEQRHNSLEQDHVSNVKRDKDFGYRLLHAVTGKETTRASLDWHMIVGMIKPGVCFFITRGGFIGFATDAARVEDVVGVVFGFPEVMLLRQVAETEGSRRLISEALVPSIQDGQLVQLYEKGKVKLMELKLV